MTCMLLQPVRRIVHCINTQMNWIPIISAQNSSEPIYCPSHRYRQYIFYWKIWSKQYGVCQLMSRRRPAAARLYHLKLCIHFAQPNNLKPTDAYTYSCYAKRYSQLIGQNSKTQLHTSQKPIKTHACALICQYSIPVYFICIFIHNTTPLDLHHHQQQNLHSGGILKSIIHNNSIHLRDVFIQKKCTQYMLALFIFNQIQTSSAILLVIWP